MIHNELNGIDENTQRNSRKEYVLQSEQLNVSVAYLRTELHKNNSKTLPKSFFKTGLT